MALALALAGLACAVDRAGEGPPGPLGTVRIGAVDWYTDYDRALDRARARRVALWVHFGENPG